MGTYIHGIIFLAVSCGMGIQKLRKTESMDLKHG
jgi:hypothetical protein